MAEAPPEPPPAPSRAGKPLAAVVAEYREAVDTLARLDLADNKGQQQLWRANDLEAAQTALAAAQERKETATYARLTGRRPAAGPSLDRAEQSVAEAEAAIDALLRARARIAEERQRVEWQLASRRGDLTVAVAAAIRESPEMAAMAETYLDALRIGAVSRPSSAPCPTARCRPPSPAGTPPTSPTASAPTPP